MYVTYLVMPAILNNSKASRSGRPSISNTRSQHRYSFSSATGVPGGARKPAHSSITLNSSGSSAQPSGLPHGDSSSSQSKSSTSRSSKLQIRLFGRKGSQTTPDTVSVNNASVNNVSFGNASLSNGPRSEVDSISSSLSPTSESSIHTTFPRATAEIMAVCTPAITEVHEDEEQQPQPNIASHPVASSGSMALNTRTQHDFNAYEDNTRSTTRDRPSPNHVDTSPAINSYSLFPWYAEQ